MVPPQSGEVHDLLPFLGDWLHGEQLLDSEKLENLEREFGCKVANNIECGLGVLLQQKNL